MAHIMKPSPGFALFQLPPKHSRVSLDTLGSSISLLSNRNKGIDSTKLLSDSAVY
jgi:hypothetical protein